MFYLGLYREVCGKKFLSETIRPRTLIFGMVMLWTSINFVQIMPKMAPGVTYFYIGLYRGEHGKTLSESIRPRAFVFGM